MFRYRDNRRHKNLNRLENSSCERKAETWMSKAKTDQGKWGEILTGRPLAKDNNVTKSHIQLPEADKGS